jgi:hypothetical protein
MPVAFRSGTTSKRQIDFASETFSLAAGKQYIVGFRVNGLGRRLADFYSLNHGEGYVARVLRRGQSKQYPGGKKQ